MSYVLPVFIFLQSRIFINIHCCTIYQFLTVIVNSYSIATLENKCFYIGFCNLFIYILVDHHNKCSFIEAQLSNLITITFIID